MKRIIALIAAVMVLIRFLTVQSFALAAPVVAGEEIIEVIIELLLASGHSQSELDGLGTTELQSLLNDDLNNGKINHGTILIDPITQAEMTVLDYLADFSQSKEGQTVSAVQSIVANEMKDFVKDLMSLAAGITVDLSPVKSVDSVDEIVEVSSTFDMYGYGACVVINTGSSHPTYRYCQYAVLGYLCGAEQTRENLRSVTYYGPYIDYSYNSKTGQYEFSEVKETSYTYSSSLVADFIFYGDIRNKDGTQAFTDDVFDYVIGEVDGTVITLDMLNPDGSVTIDGVTYYPVDYLDPDKLTDEGKQALVYNITNAITNTYVIADDEPLVDTSDIAVEVAEELEDFTISPSIITVFPFCLPFDFVRGMNLFSSKPETPHFEVTVDVPSILNIPEQHWNLVIDLEDWEPLAKITRWVSMIGFSYLLISLSTKIVKGAGA